MAKLAILFPGQGAQRPNMDTSAFDVYPEVIAGAEAIAGFSIRKFFSEASSERFRDTRFLQPALYTLNALQFRRHRDEAGGPITFLAGHSLGEFNALEAAGAFDFEAGLRLVKERASLMADSHGGGMAAVLGLGEEDVRRVIADNDLNDLSLANYNSDFQVVVSGPLNAVRDAQSVFYDNGAMNYVVLQVSGAFHSQMLGEAARKFGEHLKDFEFLAPKVPVISNTTARPHTSEGLRQSLAMHLTQPVLWKQSVLYMRAQGIDSFVEIGGSKILLDMVKNIAPDTEKMTP
jgi:malonyl CoA-acyl carrier protein transacylase